MKAKYSVKEQQAKKDSYKNTDNKGLFKKIPLFAKVLIPIAIVALIIGAIFLVKYCKNQKIAYEAYADQLLNVDTFYNGIIIEGVDMSGKTKDEAYTLLAAVEPTLRDNINITVNCCENDFTLTQDNLNFSYNTKEVIDEAYNVGREGSKKDRYRTVLKLEKTSQNFFIDHTLILDDTAVDNFVKSVADSVYIKMKPPYVSEFHPDAENMFVPHEGIPGRELNSDQLTQTLNQILKNKSYIGNVDATTKEIPVTGSIDDIPSQTVLISEYSTVSTNNSNANNNMKLALDSVNGTIIQPGETFSFNESTGDTTTADNGYLPAGAISNGKLVQEYGGGICQSATTIYGAALRADMNITERYNHRWPSSYVPIGQDATVDYPSVDLKFENSSEYPIFIKSFMSGTTLTVKIYGYQPSEWDNIEVSSQTTRTISPPAARRIADTSLESGTEVVDQSSCSGYEAQGEKLFYKNGELVKSEPIDSSYYAEGAAVIRYGP